MKLNGLKIAVLAMALLVGLAVIPAFAACPPGAISVETVAGAIVASGVYCVPFNPVAGPFAVTIAANDVTLVGETPQAEVLSVDLLAGVSMNITLQNFTIRVGGQVTNTGLVNPINFVIDGVTFNAPAAPAAIDLRGINPIVRNCTFVDPVNDVIQVNAGLNAQIYANRVSNVVATGNALVRLIVAYSGIEIYDNEFNYLDQLFDDNGVALTNGVIRDNRGGVLGHLAAGPCIDLNGGSTNVDVLNNRFNYTGAVVFGIQGNGANVRIRGNEITAILAGVNDAINFTGANWTVENNILDLRLAGAPANAVTVAAGAVNAVVRGNTILGTRDGYAIQIQEVSVLAENNTIRNVVWNPAGLFVAPAAIAVENINARLMGNTIEDVSGAYGVLVHDPAGINNVAATNAIITGNTFRRVDFVLFGAAAAANPVPQGGVAVVIYGQMNSRIENNTFEDIAGSGVAILGGILALALPGPAMNNEVRGNTFTRVATRALNEPFVVAPAQFERRFPVIAIVADADNNLVTGNTIEDVGSSTYAVGIHVVGGVLGAPVGALAGNNVISNNTIRQLINTGDVGLYAVGILMDLGLDMNNVVEGNTISNSGNMQIGIDIRIPTRGTVRNNTVEGMIWAGIYVRGGTVINRLTIEDNTLTNNHTGLRLSAGAADVADNTVTGGYTSLMVDSFGTAPWYEVENNCFMDAGVLARNDGTGTLTAQQNYWFPAPVAGTNIIGDVDFSDPLLDCPFAPTPQPDKTHTYGAAAGWYMVSVPLNSGLAADIFGATAYRWNPALGDYDLVTTINAAHGFWVMLPASKTATDTGDQVTSDVTLAISAAGWHQISAPWSYPKSAIQVIKGAETKSWAGAAAAGWVRDDIYGYVATDGFYTTPATMNPWYGYWVKAEVSGLSLKLLVASGTPVSMAYAPMAPMAFAPMGLPPMPPTFTPSAATLSFGNSPNPVVDVNTTYFEVKGAAAYLVEALKVQIYDLSGRLVYEAEEAGASLAWHTDNIDGEYLANGVYLYKLYALLDGQWVVSAVKNVVILR